MKRLEIGDTAPDFEAETDQGATIRLHDYRGQKVVLYFYPKDNTSGCTRQACALRDDYPQIEAQGAVVLGISPDGRNSHGKFREKHDLPFTLLVDSDHAIADAYAAWGEKSMYGRKYMGIIRSQFTIDKQGKLLDVQYKVSPAKSAPLVLKSLQA